MTADTAPAPSAPRTTGAPLPDDLRAALAAYVAVHGEAATANRAGLARATLARAMAGMNVHRGTVAVVQAVLAAPAGGQLHPARTTGAPGP